MEANMLTAQEIENRAKTISDFVRNMLVNGAISSLDRIEFVYSLMRAERAVGMVMHIKLTEGFGQNVLVNLANDWLSHAERDLTLGMAD
jgi:hypothetical protein